MDLPPNFSLWCEIVAGSTLIGKKPVKKPERLGVAGLALHYANIISQIDNVVSSNIYNFLFSSIMVGTWYRIT